MIPIYKKPNPLAVALGPKESSSEARANLPPPRLLELRASELPDSIRVGDTVCMKGFIRSIDSDGSVMVAFVRVMNEEKQGDGYLRVMTQESHVP